MRPRPVQRGGHPGVPGRAGGLGWAVSTSCGDRRWLVPVRGPIARGGRQRHHAAVGSRTPSPASRPPQGGDGVTEKPPACCFTPCQSGPSRGQPVPTKKAIF